MFDSLSTRIQDVFKSLRGETRLTPEHVEAALREIRLALLEADVNFKVVKAFIDRVRDRATDQAVMRSLTLDSPRLRITGKLDLVELDGTTAVPVEYRKGRPRRVSLARAEDDDGDEDQQKIVQVEPWPPDLIQVALQAELLREHGYQVTAAELYYHAERRRIRCGAGDRAFEDRRPRGVDHPDLYLEQLPSWPHEGPGPVAAPGSCAGECDEATLRRQIGPPPGAEGSLPRDQREPLHLLQRPAGEPGEMSAQH